VIFKTNLIEEKEKKLYTEKHLMGGKGFRLTGENRTDFNKSKQSFTSSEVPEKREIKRKEEEIIRREADCKRRR